MKVKIKKPSKAPSTTTKPTPEPAQEDTAVPLDRVDGDEDTHKKAKGSGTFATMGLSSALVKAVQRKGFRLPTPIQRKCIPPLLEGRDVVGMARTGSGKTAAFLLPLLHHLKCHSLRVGIRALILGPSRELVLQTHGVLQELIRLAQLDLRTVALVGGDGVEEQFVQLATNPDIMVATPGRLMHVCVETGLRLTSVEFVVWDEADRLAEDSTMAQQMREITTRLPERRQTALFSATLPGALVEFAQVGLRDPLLVRLDVESKLSPDLRLAFLTSKTNQKEAALLVILRHLITLSSSNQKDEKTVIFAATKHHVEYLQELLRSLSIPCGYIYGALDQSARRLAIEQFRKGQVPLLIVTDVAARGLDIPHLDNVINYDFPASPKLFVHRVGRVARAGRSGRAITLVSPDEYAYLFDLQLFLGKPVVSAKACSNGDEDKDKLILGDIPQMLLDEEQETLQKKLTISPGLESLQGVVTNATKLYRRTRPVASPESHRRCKEFMLLEENAAGLGIHPSLKSHSTATTTALPIIEALHNFKPRASHLSFVKPAMIKAGGNVVKTPAIPTLPAIEKSEFSLKYTKNDSYADRAYSLSSGGSRGKKKTFLEEARSAIMDLHGGDDPTSKRRSGNEKASLSKSKKPTIVTDMGTRVPASYKTEAYQRWRSRTHLDIQRPGEIESMTTSQRARTILTGAAEKRKWRQQKPRHGNKRGKVSA